MEHFNLTIAQLAETLRLGEDGIAWIRNHSAGAACRRFYRRMHQVLLFTRQGCHLCDDAEALLTSHGLSPTKIDIDASAELRDRYDTCVPVVVIDGKERFRGRVNPVLLQRLLRHG